MTARGLSRSLVAGLMAIGIVLTACAVVDVPPPSPSPMPTGTTPGSGGPTGSGGPFHVVLAQASGADVTIDVVDESGTLLDAASGTPGDGASVELYTVRATNVDATTVRLTWVDGPCDSASTLTIDATARRFLVVQPECAGDSVAYDRVLELWFSPAIDADDIEISLRDGTDTSQ